MRKAQNWDQPCPNKNCKFYGQKNKGNILSISTYTTQRGRRRVFECTQCWETFSEMRDTVFYNLKTHEEKVIMALKMILVRVSLSGICFVLGIKEETILEWLNRAYQKAEQINQVLLRELFVTEVQLDEMWSFVKRKISMKTQDEVESQQESEDGRQWIWISYAPQFRLILATVVGPRTYQTAVSLIQITAMIVMGVPCFFSDGLSCYLQALIESYHTIKTFPRTGKRGRAKDPVKEPHPDLAYGKIIKQRKQGRIVEITYQIMCGAERLARLGLKISTTLLERLNLTVRQTLAPLVRKTLSFSKEKENLQKQVTFFQVFYNFARPNMSLREELCQSTNLFEQKWKLKTPAMAAGLTDHVWTFKELLTIKLAHAP